MPYYIYALRPGENSKARDLAMVNEFKDFKDAKNAVRTLRAEEPLEEGHIYKIIFADNQAEAEQRLSEFREEPIVKEWEK